jgi:hypothetical protein
MKYAGKNKRETDREESENEVCEWCVVGVGLYRIDELIYG